VNNASSNALPPAATEAAENPSPQAVIDRAVAGASEIVLGRIGHYTYESTCQTAIVTQVVAYTDGRTSLVNLGVWTHGGQQEPRTSVPAGPPARAGESFHLTRDCPWGR
jgi:hypothetical protein